MNTARFAATAWLVLVPLGPTWARHKKTAPTPEAPPATAATSPATAAIPPATAAAPTEAGATKNQTSVTVKVNGEDVTVPAGTRVRLQIQDQLYGRHAKEGQVVHYVVAEDVLSPDRQVVIKRGAAAVGKVVSRSGTGGYFALVRKGGRLEFDAEQVTAVDGTQVPLVFHQELKGKGGAGMTILFGPGRGKDAKTKKDALYEAVVGVEATR